MANEINQKALYNIGYGLYVLTCNDGVKDNGLIVNTVMQITGAPLRVAVAVNKTNYSHAVIKNTRKLNINCLTVDTPFSVFEKFGFQSGSTVDKFKGETVKRSLNGLVVLDKNVNAYMSLQVEDCIDFGTHEMFICSVVEAETIADAESVTYAYYQKNIKPKPQTAQRKGYVCNICGYIHTGDFPADFICPLCKHGVEDFTQIKREDKTMSKYVCNVCGWIYDEELGNEEIGAAAGTKFEDLPEDFVCPICSVGKDEFTKE